MEDMGSASVPGWDISRIRAEIRPLTKLNNATAARNLLLQWVLIAGLAYLASISGSILFSIAAIVVIGSRQLALMQLTHDGIHYRMFTNRRINDSIMNYLCAAPLMINFHGFRANHLAHHQHLGTDLDPDRYEARRKDAPATKPLSIASWPKHIAKRTRLMIRFTVFSVLPGLGSEGSTPPLHHRMLTIAWGILVVGLVLATGTWREVLIYWFVPASTVLPVLLFVRSQAEHVGLNATNELNNARYTEANAIERFFFGPFGFNYHLQHHLFPAVPHYNLPKLHAILMDDPAFRENAHLTRGYLRWVLRGGLSHRYIPPDNESIVATRKP